MQQLGALFSAFEQILRDNSAFDPDDDALAAAWLDSAVQLYHGGLAAVREDQWRAVRAACISLAHMQRKFKLVAGEIDYSVSRLCVGRGTGRTILHRAGGICCFSFIFEAERAQHILDLADEYLEFRRRRKVLPLFCAALQALLCLQDSSELHRCE